MISNTKESDLVNILSEGVHGASGNNPSISSAACSTGPPHASSAPSVTNAESGSGAGHQDNLGRAPSHTPSATGQPSQANSGLSCQQLFTPSGLPEVMRLVSESSKEDEKKYVLPAAIPGFHISATQILISHKIQDLFRRGRFVGYSKLVPSNSFAPENDDQDFVINAQGGLTEKAPDLSKEYDINPLDWINAARTAVDWVRTYHGEERAAALQKHHAYVLATGQEHTWRIALEYDVRQRQLSALYHQHDLGTADESALTRITTKKAAALTVSDPSPRTPSKRKASEAATPERSKRSRSERVRCFRCGRPDHLPARCQAEKTIAGKTPFRLTPSPKNEHALSSPDGKRLCTNWARFGDCRLSTNCSFLHACSLCGDNTHGNSSCPAIRS